jgi:hypothetical protein
MKRFLRILAILVVILIPVYLFVSTAFLFSPPPSKCIADSACLTRTHWQQMGGFQSFTPDGSRIGCWGTALAQLAYYYKLEPFGQVRYTSTRGIAIDEDLRAFHFDFTLFAPQIDSGTNKETVTQLAKYNYYAALTVKKDFGTGKNMDLLPSPGLFESHYKVKVHRYISWKRFLPYTDGKLASLIYRELGQKRPVYLHFSNFKDVGHTVLVDGYCNENGVFKVHLNQGQGGPTDGWYDFYKGFLKPDDNALRVVYTFEPG